MNEADTRAELIDPELTADRPFINTDTDHWQAFVRSRGEAGKLGAKLPEERVRLFEHARNTAKPTEELCWSILEWGGMHGLNRQKLLAVEGRQWLGLANAVRSGEHDRRSAYNAFSALQAASLLPGMGPAYFTKLIYFLMPRGPACQAPGYIMDQWAGCSVNLLFESQIVLMNCVQTWAAGDGGPSLSAAYIVSNLNNGRNFEVYCKRIEEIAVKIDERPDNVELLLMSKGGKKKADWRKYVIQHRMTPRE